MDVYNIKQTISTYFRENNLSHYKLPQVYILYRALKKIGKEPILVKGYLVNHFIQNYYISFWILCEGELHNIIDETLTYSFDPNVELMEILLPDIVSSYLNMNTEEDNAILTNSFHKCRDGSETVHTIIQPLFNLLDIYNS